MRSVFLFLEIYSICRVSIAAKASKKGNDEQTKSRSSEKCDVNFEKS